MNGLALLGANPMQKSGTSDLKSGKQKASPAAKKALIRAGQHALAAGKKLSGKSATARAGKKLAGFGSKQLNKASSLGVHDSLGEFYDSVIGVFTAADAAKFKKMLDQGTPPPSGVPPPMPGNVVTYMDSAAKPTLPPIAPKPTGGGTSGVPPPMPGNVVTYMESAAKPTLPPIAPKPTPPPTDGAPDPGAPKYVMTTGPLTYGQGAAYHSEVLPAEDALTDALANVGDVLSTLSATVTVLQGNKPAVDPAIISAGQDLVTKTQAIIDQYINEDYSLATGLTASDMQGALAGWQTLQGNINTWITQAQNALSSTQQPPPIDPNAPPQPWQPKTAYAVSVQVTNQGNLFQVTTAGTSAATGSGPIALSGVVHDGTISWNALGPVSAAQQPAPPSGGGGGGGPSGGGGGGGGGLDEGGEEEGGGEDQYQQANVMPPEEEGGGDEYAPPPPEDVAPPEDDQGDSSMDSDLGSGFDLLGADDLGGGGGHGSGHGHGGHHHGGGRGFRGGGFYGYGGPWWYGEPWYYEGLEDELTADQFAELVAQKLRQKKSHVGYAAPETHWYTLATPGAILDEMDKVMREADTLDADVKMYYGGSDASFASYKIAWGAFLADYKKFYDDNKGWFSRLSSSVGDHAVSYGNQLNDWREKLRGFHGARVTEPKITAVQVRSDPSKFNWKPLVIGGVVVAGLFGGGFALSKVASVGNLFKRRA